jgi:hypothetical protein
MAQEKIPGAKAYMNELTNLRKWTITGRGTTGAECIAMVKAIAKVSAGTVAASYEAVALAGTDIPAPSGGTAWTDALFTFTKGNQKRTLRVNNIDAALTLPGGVVNTANADIVALVAAFRDEDGIGGYALKSAIVVA